MHFYTWEKNLDTDNTQFFLAIIPSLGSLPPFPEVITMTSFYAFDVMLATGNKLLFQVVGFLLIICLYK